MKTASALPIYKSEDEDMLSDYRTDSLVSQLIERLVYRRLNVCVTNNHLLYKYQFGFERRKSTHIALLLPFGKITEAVDKGEYVVCIILDYSMVFGPVSHDSCENYQVQYIAMTLLKIVRIIEPKMPFIIHKSTKKEYVVYH